MGAPRHRRDEPGGLGPDSRREKSGDCALTPKCGNRHYGRHPHQCLSLVQRPAEALISEYSNVESEPPLNGGTNRLTATIVILGGMTIVVGTLMPWMSLFAGLHTYRGIIGLYGRLIAGGGVVAVSLGVLLGARDNRLLRWSAGLVGGAIFFFSAVLLRNLFAVVGNLRGDPMMVASIGDGLYVCLVGAATVCGASFQTQFGEKAKKPVANTRLQTTDD